MALLLLLVIAAVVLLLLRQRALDARITALEHLLHGDTGEGWTDEAAPAAPRAAPSAAEPAAAAPPRETVQTAAQAWLGAEHEEAEPQSQAAPPASETLSALFERFVGGRLLIWIGGIALAVAGIFLIRFSVGLITPPIRIGLAALLGLLLIGGGEMARREKDAKVDPRVGQALVGAGILVLYAAPYGALVLYHLIAIGTASALMVAVTAAALLLSLRHGAPSAVMGLAGGFATPLLVGDPNSSALPLLAYLALLDIALFLVARRRGWGWIAAGCVVISFAWMAPLLFARPDDALAAGGFILLLSIAGSLVRVGEDRQLDMLRPAAIGLIQLAILVGRLDLGLPAWALFGALSAASFWLAGRRSECRLIPALALVAALVLIAGRALAGGPDGPRVAAALTLLFAAGAAFNLWRRPERMIWTLIGCAAAAGPAIILRIASPAVLTEVGWGLAFLALAAIPLLLGLLLPGREGGGRPRAAAGATWALLSMIAGWQLIPDMLVGAVWLVIAIALALAGRRRAGLAAVALAVAGAAALWTAAMVADLWTALAGASVGLPVLAPNLPGAAAALQALALPALLLLVLWRLLPNALRRLPFAAACLLLAAAAYVLFKQAYGLSSGPDFVARGFAERLAITQSLFVAGWLVCGGRVPLPGVDAAQARRIGIILTALAAARLVWFDMLTDNPLLIRQSVGSLPVLNLLLPAYLLGGFWLYRARRGADSPVRSALWLVLALAASILGVMLMVRQGFQGAILSNPGIPSSESYGYSLAGLLLSMALLGAGIRLPDKALRLAGLVLLTATTLKVFLIDASALEGLLRILSFLGLGVALIGIGKLYSKVLDAEAGPPAAA